MFRVATTYPSQMRKAFVSTMTVEALPVWYPTHWTASPGIVFLPSVVGVDWNHPQEGDRRKQGAKTAGHATEDKIMERSECCWEFDAWRDIFSKIRDDPLLAM